MKKNPIPKPKPQTSDWIVRVRCIIIKDIYADNCTATEAVNNPFGFSEHENEVAMLDWEVLKVEPNG